MTEADVRKHQEPAAAVKQLHCQSASSQLITSSIRKPGDKRRAAEAQSDVTSPSKRHRVVDEDDGVDCCTASRLEDQENAHDQGVHGAAQQQHQEQQDQEQQEQQCGDDCAPDAAKGGALTTIFSPLYLLYQGGHQLAQQLAGAYTGQQPQPDLPHSHDHHHLLPLSPELQQQAQQHQQEVAQYQQHQQEDEEGRERQQEPARAANSTDSSEAEHTSGCPPRPPTPLCSASTCSDAQQQQQPKQPLVQSAPQPAAAAAATDEEDEEDDDCFDPYLFISRLPPLKDCAGPGPRSVLLPRRTRAAKQKTLVLDLDETLVHSTLGAEPDNAPDFSFPVTFNGAVHMVHVRQRPHMLNFLERVADLYEVVIFTASQKLYAEKLLNVLDPRRKLIRHRIYRDSCVLVEGNYLKDLSVLGRDLAHTLIVDNSPQAFGFQLDNGVPIESWYDDSTDDELLRLLPFLEDLAKVEDVRPHISQRFRLREVVRGAAAEGNCLVLRP